MMVQCSLHRDTGKGTNVTTTWLPQRFAVYGKYLELLIDGEWQNGWKVVRVYNSTKRTEDELLTLAVQYKKTRSVSDV